MRIKSLSYAVIGILAGTMLGAQSPADAQTGSSSNDAAPSAVSNPKKEKKDQPHELQAVVVSARKRSEDVEKTPISITSFTGEDLDQRGVTNISQIGMMSPNVSFDAGSAISGSSNTMTVFIRGVGQTDFNLTTDPGVGIYLDGVYIARSVGGLLDTADIAQIDVLRGPQGTLFGKNTIGGAIVLTSRQPDQTPAASVEVTTGSLDRRDLKAKFNMPVTSDFAVLGSLSSQRRDGYATDIATGRGLGGKDNISGRLVAAWTPTDKLNFTLALDGSHAHEEAPAVKFLKIYPSALFPTIYNKYSPTATGCSTSNVGSNCYGSQWLTGGNYSNNDGDADTSKANTFGISLTANWDMDWAKFKSITAFRHLNSAFGLDEDGSPLTVWNTTNSYKDKQLSQEFQLSGDAFDERLKWVTGLYYLSEWGTDRNILGKGSDLISFLSGGRILNKSAAWYGQLSYDLTDRLGLTLGSRFSYEKKEFLPDQYVLTITEDVAELLYKADDVTNINGNGGLLQVGDRLLPHQWSSTTTHNFSPAATLDYKFSDTEYAYLSYSEGFKSGGFTQRVFPPLTEIPSYNPEYVKSYELGLKSKFFDNRLTFNVDVFNMNYTDMQESVTVFVAPTTQNAGKAQIRGLEAEFQALPWTWLQLNGGMGFTHAKYLSIEAAAAPITINSYLPDTPKWTATLGATAYFYENSHGSLNLRVDASYKSGTYKDAVNTALLYQPAFVMGNASLNLVLPNSHWSISGGVSNFTNKHYLVTGYASTKSAGVIYGIYGDPREWFLKVRYDY